MSKRLQSPAWVADGLFSCRSGVLALDEDEIRLVLDDGRTLFGGPVEELRPRFPWWLVDGLILSPEGGERTVLFSDPYEPLGPTDAARAARKAWRAELQPARGPRPTVGPTHRRTPASHVR